MKKIVALALVAAFACMLLAGCNVEINNGSEDILYNDIVYERFDGLSYNLKFSEEHSRYIGDFLETYNYGQQLPWEVYALNDEETVLYSAHAVWLKPGYRLPEEFGEEFSSVEYVVSEGIDFLVMEDAYTEEVTPLADFEGSVKLEDIVESQPSDITEFTEHDTVRFVYKNHADILLYFTLCSADGKYYLNVCHSEDGTTALFEIRPQYVSLLTAAVVDKE